MQTFESPGHPGTTAIQTAEPLFEDYPCRLTEDAFDWQAIVSEASALHPADYAEFYLVVFRSVRRPEADGNLIAKLDEAAHIEAAQSKALIHYSPGEADPQGRALSWCLWSDAASARLALSGPAHQRAVDHAPEFYEDFGIELYNLSIEEHEVIFRAVQHPAVRP